MEEQVAVVYCIHTSMREQYGDMLVQFFACGKGVVQLFHQQFFLRSESVGVRRIDGREVAACHVIFLSFYCAYSTLIVDAVEEASVVHLPFWMSSYYLCLGF